MGRHAGLRSPGDAKVDHSRPVVGQQHGGRLEVTVHHPGRVDRGQAFCQPRGQHEDRSWRKRPVGRHRVGQRWARYVGRGQPRRGAVQVSLDQRRRVQAVHLPRRVDFAPEPSPELGVSGQVGADYLDGHGPSPRGPAQEHVSHPTAAQPSDQPVRPDPLRIAGLQFRHAHLKRAALTFRQVTVQQIALPACPILAPASIGWLTR